jgi:hypothetical protein
MIDREKCFELEFRFYKDAEITVDSEDRVIVKYPKRRRNKRTQTSPGFVVTLTPPKTLIPTTSFCFRLDEQNKTLVPFP